MSVTIEKREGLWRWEVECDDADYSGTCETREEAEAAAAAAEEYDGPCSTWSDESDTYIASLESQVAALTAERDAAGGAALMEVAHAVERTRRAVLAEVIDLLDTRAVQRSAQVDVAQEAGGAWQVVAGKGSELMAVADLLRLRLRPGPEAATG